MTGEDGNGKEIRAELRSLRESAGKAGQAIKGNRASISRLDVLIKEHENRSLDRDAELHTRVDDVNEKVAGVREEMTKFRTESRLADVRQDEQFNELKQLLVPVMENHQTLVGLPKLIKWVAAILTGIVSIVGASIAIFLYLQTLSKSVGGP